MDGHSQMSQPPGAAPGTVGEALRHGLDLLICCLRCRRCTSLLNRWLDRVLETHGDVTLEALAARFPCPHCGHHAARVTARSPWVMPPRGSG